MRRTPPPKTMPVKHFIWADERDIVSTADEYKAMGTALGPTYNALNFVKLLAKIAHSYAVAELGLGAFQQTLCPLILGENEESDYVWTYVGGVLDDIPRDDDLFHLSLTTGVNNSTGQKVVMVSIRLFPFIGAPLYVVVPGIITKS